MDGCRYRTRRVGLDRPTGARSWLTREMIGIPRHLSQHVGGFVIPTEGPLDRCARAVMGMAERTASIEWDKGRYRRAKILKVDVLALGMLTCMQMLRPDRRPLRTR